MSNSHLIEILIPPSTLQLYIGALNSVRKYSVLTKKLKSLYIRLTLIKLLIPQVFSENYEDLGSVQ